MKKLTQEELNVVLEIHKKWLNDEKDGIQANLSEMDLCGLNLNHAQLNRAQLNRAKLNRAKLNYAELNDAELNDAELNHAELNYAELNYAELNYAELNYTELNGAELNYTELNRAKLNHTQLNGAKLNYAKLKYVELNHAKLNCAELNGANLSGIKNSPFFNQYKWMTDNFKSDSEGFFIFKRIGNGQTTYNIPDHWNVEEGSFVSEEVNVNRTDECGCGINFGNKEYIEKYYNEADIWLCKLYFEDLMETCVPIHTDGKARCSRLKLLRKISLEEMKGY